MINKPKKHIKKYYDYHECRNYLQQKYGYDERDYANKFGTLLTYASKQTQGEDVPYRDFWHWIGEHYDIHNGCFITFHPEMIDDPEGTEDWHIEIYQRYLDEFADEDGSVEFYVWW